MAGVSAVESRFVGSNRGTAVDSSWLVMVRDFGMPIFGRREEYLFLLNVANGVAVDLEDSCIGAFV